MLIKQINAILGDNVTRQELGYEVIDGKLATGFVEEKTTLDDGSYKITRKWTDANGEELKCESETYNGNTLVKYEASKTVIDGVKYEGLVIKYNPETTLPMEESYNVRVIDDAKESFKFNRRVIGIYRNGTTHYNEDGVKCLEEFEEFSPTNENLTYYGVSREYDTKTGCMTQQKIEKISSKDGYYAEEKIEARYSSLNGDCLEFKCAKRSFNNGSESYEFENEIYEQDEITGTTITWKYDKSIINGGVKVTYIPGTG